MKKLPWLFALIIGGSAGLTLSLRAQAPEAAAAKTPADLDYEAIWVAYRKEAPADAKSTPRESFKWTDEKFQQFSAAARAFGEKYPTDPRRYEGWVQSSYTGPVFITGFKPDFDEKPGWGNIISDESKVVAYRSRQVELLTQVIEAPDATVRQRAGAFNALIVDSGTVAKIKGQPFDVRSLRPFVDRVVAKFPDERVVPIISIYADRIRWNAPAEAEAFENGFKINPVLAAAIEKVAADRKAAEEKRAADQKVQAAEIGLMKFTAADGREVDITKLKGKVVLVDFWATWCGPCIAEIPNVIANYNKYHDKGFEVVGITLENPNASPKDTAEQTAAKLEKAKAKMLAFTAEKQMPWPQYFDGKWWKNDYAVKFGINAIPAMFLLDQDGKIVSTEARGPKLEAEIKRLLKL